MQNSVCYILQNMVIPFSISYNNGLVMMNSFSFTLSGKLFICFSNLNGRFFWVEQWWPEVSDFHDFEYFLPIPFSLQSFFCKISWLSYGNFFSLAALKILSLSCICFVWESLCFLDLHVYFLYQIREVFFHYFFKKVCNFLLLLFSFWHP